jgi:hypothetical protein
MVPKSRLYFVPIGAAVPTHQRNHKPSVRFVPNDALKAHLAQFLEQKIQNRAPVF